MDIHQNLRLCEMKQPVLNQDQKIFLNSRKHIIKLNK